MKNWTVLCRNVLWKSMFLSVASSVCKIVIVQSVCVISCLCPCPLGPMQTLSQLQHLCPCANNSYPSKIEKCICCSCETVFIKLYNTLRYFKYTLKSAYLCFYTVFKFRRCKIKTHSFTSDRNSDLKSIRQRQILSSEQPVTIIINFSTPVKLTRDNCVKSLKSVHADINPHWFLS